MLSAKAGQQFGLQRNEALFERASTIASRGILRTGPLPSVDETSSFTDLEARLAAESERIGAEMRRLTALHDEALAQLQIVRSMLLPVRRLPREILSEIFLETLHPLDACRAYSGFRLRYVACDGASDASPMGARRLHEMFAGLPAPATGYALRARLSTAFETPQHHQ